jgi:hypothetical protein
MPGCDMELFRHLEGYRSIGAFRDYLGALLFRETIPPIHAPLLRDRRFPVVISRWHFTHSHPSAV